MNEAMRAMAGQVVERVVEQAVIKREHMRRELNSEAAKMTKHLATSLPVTLEEGYLRCHPITLEAVEHNMVASVRCTHAAWLTKAYADEAYAAAADAKKLKPSKAITFTAARAKLITELAANMKETRAELTAAKARFEEYATCVAAVKALNPLLEHTLASPTISSIQVEAAGFWLRSCEAKVAHLELCEVQLYYAEEAERSTVTLPKRTEGAVWTNSDVTQLIKTMRSDDTVYNIQCNFRAALCQNASKALLRSSEAFGAATCCKQATVNAWGWQNEAGTLTPATGETKAVLMEMARDCVATSEKARDDALCAMVEAQLNHNISGDGREGAERPTRIDVLGLCRELNEQDDKGM
eukprot:1516980-Prymnesium_polylepis.3